MKRRTLASALVCLLVAALCGCAVQEAGPIAGSDWRTYRGYSYAEINAEENVHLLYFYYDEGVLAFYLDEASQTEILQIDMLEAADPQRALESIRFADHDGDGYNDLSIAFAQDETRFWHWDPKTRLLIAQ